LLQGRGGNRGGGKPRGGGRGGGNAGAGGQQTERKPREAILDLGRFVDKEVRIKFQGGREVGGVLKGYDQLQNLVLDEVREEPTGMSTVRQIRDWQIGGIADMAYGC
jgi:U6 snRNA-associated Sm-like protein LSm7